MESQKTRKKVALITGASSGIGKELARLHAQHSGDLVLVARSEAKLSELAAELHREHGSQAMVITQDLSQPSAPRQVYEAIKAAGLKSIISSTTLALADEVPSLCGGGRTSLP